MQTQTSKAVETVSAYRVQRMLQVFGYMKMNITALLQECQLSWPDLEDTEARVPVSTYTQLIERAQQQSDAATFGLKMGELLPMGRWDLIERILHSSNTVEVALRNVLRYWNLVADEQHVSLGWGGEWANLTLKSYLPSSPEASQIVEAELLYITRFFRFLLCATMPWDEITFQHSPLTERANYERLFDGLVIFNQPSHTIRFDASFLALRLDPSSEVLKEQLSYRRKQRSIIAVSKQPLSRKVKHLLRLSPLCHDPQVIASQLGMHEDEFTEALKSKEGLRFQQIIDQEIRNRAHQYLNDPSLPLSEAAFLLGFSSQRGFERTIQQWFGASPDILREQSPRTPAVA